MTGGRGPFLRAASAASILAASLTSGLSSAGRASGRDRVSEMTSSPMALLVVVALVFDFPNGLHDTANAMATTIATGALKPRIAVGIAAQPNVGGAFISITVAATVTKGIVDAEAVSPTMIFAGPVRAMTWNLITWWFGVPSTSSHALIGAVIAGVGTSAIEPGSILSSVIIPALIAPRAVTVVSVLIVAAAVITGIYFITDK